MDFDKEAQRYLTDHSHHIGDAYTWDNALLCLLASIAYSLCGLNEKLREALEEDDASTPESTSVID